MYGMVNEGIRDFILKHHDAQTWERICTAANLDRQIFDDMGRYEDSVTFDLVQAISDHTGLSAGDVLGKFGTHWIDYASTSRYGNLMKAAGDSFLEKLKGLDEMHARVKGAMPDLQPPSFRLEEVADGTYHLHYVSQRNGLDAMVVGMLHGLAEDTGARIEVRQMAEKSATVDHSIFEITLAH